MENGSFNTSLLYPGPEILEARRRSWPIGCEPPVIWAVRCYGKSSCLWTTSQRGTPVDMGDIIVQAAMAVAKLARMAQAIDGRGHLYRGRATSEDVSLA